MTEIQLRVIDIKDLTNDPGKLTRMWILQLIGQHNEPLAFNRLAQTIVEHLETADPKTLRMDYTPHNSLDEVLSGMSNLGLLRKQRADGKTSVQLTPHGKRLVTFLPPGIPQALGFKGFNS